MEYKISDGRIVARIDKGEEIVESLLTIAAAEKIAAASVSGIGATDNFTIGVFHPGTKEYTSKTFTGDHEILSLNGTLSCMESEPYAHIHMCAANGDCGTVGGHLNNACISATSEIVLSIIDAEIDRKYSEEIGLNLIDFK